MSFRRTELTTPASNPAMIEKALRSEADVVILDLEDSVAESEKLSARNNAATALTTSDWGRKTRAVRVNGLGTGWAVDDIATLLAAAGEALDLIVLPKVRSASDVLFFQTLISEVALARGLTVASRFEVLIEEVEALANVESIARATDTIDALVFGFVDFAASMGIEVPVEPTSAESDPWRHIQQRIIMAARIAGIDAIQGPSPNFRELGQLAATTRYARQLGFNARWCIHPAQVPIISEAFAPTPEELHLARRIVEAYDSAVASGRGAISVDGVMTDAASVRRWRALLPVTQASQREQL